ncbi:hypothetical protein PR202_gb03673 [Eleusine coracana subsp. coracana]|uniref:Uncharacterized protein n=1 Tax=Eleusine coracana subsp. coracana TaxID=191504 RepID=A0AAV5E3G5_ELECO|nr:hypothetical protein PR202_gb03673 [Eleusine coracana subsp. coracana]
MGCTTSHDAFAAAVRSRARRHRASASSSRRADPAALCRERAALIRAAADRRFALAAAHAAYFRSLAAVGDALRRFAAAALAPSSSSSPSSPVLTLPPSPAKPLTEDPSNGAAQYTQGDVTYGYGYEYPYGPYGEVVTPPPTEEEIRPAETSSSPWDFFDPFTTYDQFMADYSNNPNYAELRRMEGIPELEDEAELDASFTSTAAHQNAKGKGPIIPDNKDPSSAAKLHTKIAPPSNGAHHGKPDDDSVPSNGTSKTKETVKATVDGASSSNNGKKKSVAFDDEHESIRPAQGGGKSVQSAVSTGSSFSPLHHGTRDVVEAMDEIKEHFDEAVNCGAEVSRLLEVGKLPRRTTPRVFRYFSSRVVDPLALTVSTSSCLPRSHSNKSRPPSSKAGSSASSSAGRGNGAGNLSTTLEKLWVWEKKLYKEIKDGEKLQMEYEKKCKRLKYLDERGAESSLIDSTRQSIRLLRSKISINIKTADAFSSKIQQIRDEELYPQLVDLVQRFRGLWKAVLACHEKQLLAIQESKIHQLKAMTISQSSVASTASQDLERELTKWYRCFNKWISSQRSYVEALNGWLRKWMTEVQEEVTADGVPPFSPGRLGCPPAFVISNDWFQAIDRVSKSEVLKAMDHFSKIVREFKKSQEDEQRQKRKADHASRDYNKRREDLKGELGLSTSPDVAAVMENPRYSHDDRVLDLVKARRRRDDERTRHDKILNHCHVAASATLPIGLVPMLQQIVSFFEGNMQVYMQIRIQAPEPKATKI